jgi:hypothetical protein
MFHFHNKFPLPGSGSSWDTAVKSKVISFFAKPQNNKCCLGMHGSRFLGLNVIKTLISEARNADVSQSVTGLVLSLSDTCRVIMRRQNCRHSGLTAVCFILTTCKL